MPKDNIERAIARGSGAAADGETFEHITYEGYGPAGVAVFVDALTDNRNRTASEVRHVFAKSEGSLGESGSVAWLFERTGLLLVPADGVDEDELTLAAADGGADDVSQDGSVFEITCPAENVGEVRRALEQADRRDLIGSGCDCLIPERAPKEALDRKRKRANEEAGRTLAKSPPSGTSPAGRSRWN